LLAEDCKRIPDREQAAGSRGEMMDRQTVFDYIKKKYHVLPEYPWRKYDSNAVFRHTDNKKWFALVMDVQGNKLGLSGSEYIDVVNLKMDDLFFRDIIIKEDGIMPAYHMNKMHWVTVLLNGMVPEKRVLELIDMSFLATASAKKKEKVRPPKEWIIPSNPKYYDIIHAFDETDTIDWKQGAGIKMGDTVFMYVGAPVSAVLYKCKVLETNIPYQYQDKKLTITALMKIRLLKRYAPEQFTFEILKSEYGIFAVRGPRGVPNSLSAALKG
jgi:predicted DNA-binding protein (MmcQ/YjbR family)